MSWALFTTSSQSDWSVPLVPSGTGDIRASPEPLNVRSIVGKKTRRTDVKVEKLANAIWLLTKLANENFGQQAKIGRPVVDCIVLGDRELKSINFVESYMPISLSSSSF